MFILDTCTLIWLILQPEYLSTSAKTNIKNHIGGLFVSAMSAFEVAMHAKKKVITLPMPAYDWFQEALNLHGLKELAINSDIAASSVLLPPIHKDPIDRIIIATAIQHKLKILTPDNHMHCYSNAKCIW